eukprot:scaffold149033_cov31-Prasinocladus_malaysianus.AAC.1
MLSYGEPTSSVLPYCNVHAGAGWRAGGQWTCWQHIVRESVLLSVSPLKMEVFLRKNSVWTASNYDSTVPMIWNSIDVFMFSNITEYMVVALLRTMEPNLRTKENHTTDSRMSRSGAFAAEFWSHFIDFHTPCWRCLDR